MLPEMLHELKKNDVFKKVNQSTCIYIKYNTHKDIFLLYGT